MKNLILGVILPVALVVSGIALLVILQIPEPARTELPNPNDEGALLAYLPIAEVAEVRLLADSLNLDVSGTVVPYREVQLATEAAGRIVEKDPDVRSGTYVRKGQILYRVDPRDYELEIERLQRRRDQEVASIQELQQEIENAENLLEVAEEQLKLAEADVRRFESMNKTFASASELDEARRSRLSALNQRVTLQNQIRSAKTRRSRLESAAKLVETEIEQAELDLQRTVIRAPVDGRVVSEEVEVDSYVQKGTLLLVIEDTSKVEVACNIRMDQLSWILDQPGVSTDKLVNAARAARFELPETPVEISYSIAGRDTTTYTWDGVLDRIDGVGLDPLSRTVPIRIRVDNPGAYRTADGRSIEQVGPPMLVRGMFVDIVVKARPTSRLMLVPKLSIKPATGSSVIWKFAQNREVIRKTPKALEAIAAYQELQKDASKAESLEDSAEEQPQGTDSEIDPHNWDAGNLEIVKDVRLVTAYWGGADKDIEYWVCEVPGNDLQAGDKVIISPLPGIRADGTDPVRVRRQQPGSDLARDQASGTESHHKG